MTPESSSILVVDDDENQRWMVKKYLEKHGFSVGVAEDGVSMRLLMSEHSYELVLLDISMPGEDGFSVARYLREHHNVGIIMLTAARELLDRVLGLEIGADDYITKPFEPRELLARVKSVLRRIDTQRNNADAVAENDQNQVVKNAEDMASAQFGNFVLNLSTNRLIDHRGDDVAITSMELDLLKVFAENPGIVLSRDSLLTSAYKQEVSVFDRSIDIRIARIRRKIESDPSKPEIIKTVRGVGYVYSQEC